MGDDKKERMRREWTDKTQPPIFTILSNTSSSSECASSQPSGCNTPTTATPTPTPCTPKPKVDFICRWQSCGEERDTSADLAEHVTTEHSQKQIKKGGKKFVCLWEGCKVYNTPSMSATWLPKHVLTHCGDKPFRCVFAGCNQSYRTEKGLMRHCQSHLNASKQNLQQKATRNEEKSPGKALKKKKRVRKRVSMVKPDDFFDTRMVDVIHNRLVELNKKTRIDVEGKGTDVIFKSSIIGKRTNEDGQSMVLLRWSPLDVIPDSWVAESDLKANKRKAVPIGSLPPEKLNKLGSGLVSPKRRRKQTRK